jgi:G:T/U-mismatch repair DNA glycosylase
MFTISQTTNYTAEQLEAMSNGQLFGELERYGFDHVLPVLQKEEEAAEQKAKEKKTGKKAATKKGTKNQLRLTMCHNGSVRAGGVSSSFPTRHNIAERRQEGTKLNLGVNAKAFEEKTTFQPWHKPAFDLVKEVLSRVVADGDTDGPHPDAFCVTINFMTGPEHYCDEHTDDLNITHQYGFTLGEFTGGKLKCMRADGSYKSYNNYRRVLKVDGRRPHSVETFSGKRMAVYVYKNYDVAQTELTPVLHKPEWVTEHPDRKEVACFRPIVDSDTHTLILGTSPGDASVQQQQYYTRSDNAFWHMVAELESARVKVPVGGFKPNIDTKILQHLEASDGRELDYDACVQVLQSHGMGLWDVYGSCSRVGSSDSTISDQEPNDIRGLVGKGSNKIEEIWFNGQDACKQFCQSNAGWLGTPGAFTFRENRITQKLFSNFLPKGEGASSRPPIHLAVLPSTSGGHAAMSYIEKRCAWFPTAAPTAAAAAPTAAAAAAAARRTAQIGHLTVSLHERGSEEQVCVCVCVVIRVVVSILI